MKSILLFPFSFLISVIISIIHDNIRCPELNADIDRKTRFVESPSDLKVIPVKIKK